MPEPARRTPAPLDPIRLNGQRLDNRYDVAEKVGEGGSAYVYLATDSVTGDRVAIKVLLPELLKDAVAMERLRREASIGGKLEHPNICHILRMGRTSGFEYVVMPYLDGELLIDRVVANGRLPLDVAAKFVRDISDGLHYAHQRGVVHRDLKPENIMIARGADGSERAVVMDFGLAIARDLGADSARLTRTGLVVGTPEFMSPEQMCGQPVDPRSDVYSMAFMIYELLSGKLPFEAKTQHALMVVRLQGTAIPLRERCPDLNIPEPVEQVLARALRKEPAERYRSMPEFAEAFARAARGESLPPEAPATASLPATSAADQAPTRKRGILGALFRR